MVIAITSDMYQRFNLRYVICRAYCVVHNGRLSVW